jgi:hypothetical protein
MSKIILVFGGLLAALVMASPASLGAAELEAPAVAAPRAPAPADCGPCGCLRVEYVYHRELLSTYGLSFDPRNFDTTEPYYYFGRIRRYPRYLVDGWTGYRHC